MNRTHGDGEKIKRRCAPGGSIGKIGTEMAASWERRAHGGGAYGGSLATVQVHM